MPKDCGQITNKKDEKTLTEDGGEGYSENIGEIGKPKERYEALTLVPLGFLDSSSSTFSFTRTPYLRSFSGLGIIFILRMVET